MTSTTLSSRFKIRPRSDSWAAKDACHEQCLKVNAEPPSCNGAQDHVLIGKDSHGHWVVKDEKRLRGGIFVDRVFPAEIENVLLDCPGVAEVAVVGMPDSHWGEMPVAAIVRKNASAAVPTADDVSTFVQDRLARYKQPRRIVFVDKLPRNALGKVTKDDLRRQLPPPSRERANPVASNDATSKDRV